MYWVLENLFLLTKDKHMQRFSSTIKIVKSKLPFSSSNDE